MKQKAIYEIGMLEQNLQERLLKNYFLASNRAKWGHVSSDCFWAHQAMAGILMEALPMSRYVSPKMYDALYNIYLKLSVK